ncbi:MAG: Type 1 glutamine amidotransferase-like domain-containing protein [Erysipelotrichaceae bacterium]|nr:Type 1 glutamine amidotransferase-like domain-containing protein [Erysipelotrichaceae bacterium]
MNRQPKLFLMAGGETSFKALMNEQLRLIYDASGKPEPTVAYIGTASQDNKAFYFFIKKTLMKAGAGDVLFVRLASEKADLAQAQAQLTSADIIFLSGGEVEDGMRWLNYHRLTAFLHELLTQGKVFFGLSAGSIMLGKCWVKWTDPQDDQTAELFDCLNFIPEIFDTHAENEDWIELKTALRLSGNQAAGYGIGSGAMLTVDEQGGLQQLYPKLWYFTYENGVIKQVPFKDH